MTGYSGKTLVRKLGLQGGQRVLILDAPQDYERTVGRLPNGTTLDRRPRGVYDVIHIFVDRRQRLENQISALKDVLEPDGMLWVSWPKKAAGVRTDVTEDVVREIALANGLVDVKVAAIDDVWSGLKLVRRLEDR